MDLNDLVRQMRSEKQAELTKEAPRFGAQIISGLHVREVPRKLASPSAEHLTLALISMFTDMVLRIATSSLTTSWSLSPLASRSVSA